MGKNMKCSIILAASNWISFLDNQPLIIIRCQNGIFNFSSFWFNCALSNGNKTTCAIILFALHLSKYFEPSSWSTESRSFKLEINYIYMLFSLACCSLTSDTINHYSWIVLVWIWSHLIGLSIVEYIVFYFIIKDTTPINRANLHRYLYWRIEPRQNLLLLQTKFPNPKAFLI